MFSKLFHNVKEPTFLHPCMYFRLIIAITYKQFVSECLVLFLMSDSTKLTIKSNVDAYFQTKFARSLLSNNNLGDEFSEFWAVSIHILKNNNSIVFAQTQQMLAANFHSTVKQNFSFEFFFDIFPCKEKHNTFQL